MKLFFPSDSSDLIDCSSSATPRPLASAALTRTLHPVLKDGKTDACSVGESPAKKLRKILGKSRNAVKASKIPA